MASRPARKQRDQKKNVRRKYEDTETKSAVVLVNGREKKVGPDVCLAVNINCGPLGVLRLSHLWREEEELFFRATLFFKPQRQDETKSGEHYGEDEVIELNREVVLSKSELEELCCPDTGIGGTELYVPHQFSQERINTLNYLRLTKPKSRLSKNVSAIVERRLLGSMSSLKTTSSVGDKSSISGGSKRKDSYELVVLSYEDYCHVRKLKAALETGLPVLQSDASKYHLLGNIRKRIVFSREKSSNRRIECHNGSKFHLGRRIAAGKRKDRDEEQDNIDDAMYHKFKGRTTSLEIKIVQSMKNRKQSRTK